MIVTSLTAFGGCDMTNRIDYGSFVTAQNLGQGISRWQLTVKTGRSRCRLMD
jgi:hypothetical protein